MPQQLCDEVLCLVAAAPHCCGNLVCSTSRLTSAGKAVKEMVARVLWIGSPCEYVLQVKYEETGLPEGAAKHLLPIKEDTV